jgi:membrane-associated protease RseP (regulator of RpoE activity)
MRSKVQSLAALGFCLACLFARSEDAPAAKPAKEEQLAKIRELIKSLDSDSYSDRLTARSELMEIGRPAIEPLEAATVSEEPEIRLRATELLIALRGRGFLGVHPSEGEDEYDNEPGDDSVETPLVKVIQVVDGGDDKPFPAEKAGIIAGDRIVSVNDRPVSGVKDLIREIITIGPARTALVLIERDGKRLRLPVTLTRNNTGGNFGAPPVDLEKELESASPEKKTTEAKKDEPLKEQ